MRFTATSLALCALLFSSPTLDAVAAPPPGAPAAATVHIEIAVVRAGHGDRSIDPSLSAFAADLRALPYERFVRVDSKSVATTPGARQEITLGGGLRAVVTVDAIDDSGAATTLALFRNDREVTHTTVKRPWGRAQVISVGKEGEDMLVVPIAITR
jgi:hypothetical protein